MLGLPPFNGFISKILIYQASAQHGWVELLALLLATTLAGLALVRLARDRLLGLDDDMPTAVPVMLGESEFKRLTTRRLEPEPRGAALLTVCLLTVCLGIGLYPQPVLEIIGEVVSGLTFIRAL